MSSTTGGFLPPAPAPAPLEGAALMDAIQAWVVGVTGMDGKLVRPAWQPEPPVVPEAGASWAAFRLGEDRKSVV